MTIKENDKDIREQEKMSLTVIPYCNHCDNNDKKTGK